MADPFIGEIRAFGCDFAPRGWAFANGNTLPVAQNTSLFAILGSTYGGDGRTTVGLPNLVGRAPAHAGHGSGLSPVRLGQLSGSETITLTSQYLPSHTHTVSANPNGDVNTAVDNFIGDTFFADSSTGTMDAGSISTVGGSQGRENMQPWQALNFCVNLDGLFPSQG